MSMGIGRSGFNLTAVASMIDSATNSYNSQELRSELAIGGNKSKEYFAALQEKVEEINAEFGKPLTWYSTENVQTCRVYVRKTVKLFDESDWPNQHEWLLTNLEKMRAAFEFRVKKL